MTVSLIPYIFILYQPAFMVNTTGANSNIFGHINKTYAFNLLVRESPDFILHSFYFGIFTTTVVLIPPVET